MNTPKSNKSQTTVGLGSMPLLGSFALFSESRYPVGGMWDYEGCYETQEEARAEAMRLQKDLEHDWYHIVDRATMRIVEQKLPSNAESCHASAQSPLLWLDSVTMLGSFALFSESRYPVGGMWDYDGCYETQEEARAEAMRLQKDLEHDWYHIVDRATMRIVEYKHSSDAESCYASAQSLLPNARQAPAPRDNR